MGKKYYGGIGTDKGFVMHSPESKYRYSPDDEFHKEGDKRDVGSTSNTGGGNSNSNDSTHNESSDESTGSVQSNFDAPYDDDCNNRDDELDDFFGDLLSIKACIALAIEGLFKAFMSRSMKRIDFVAVTLMLLVCMRVIGAVFIDSSSLRLCLRSGAERARHVHDFRKMPDQRAYGTRDRVLAGPHRSRHRLRGERLGRRRVQPHHELGAGWLSGQRSSSDCRGPN